MPSRRALLAALATLPLAGCTAGEAPGRTDSATQTPPETDPSETTARHSRTDEPTTPAGPAPTVAWRAPLEAAPTTRPAVAPDRGLALVGTDAGALVAVDLGDGTERWTFEAPNPVATRSTAGGALLVAGDSCYAVSGRDGGFSGGDYRVHAVALDDGSERWTAGPPEAWSGRWLSPLAVAGDALLVGSNDDALSDAGDPAVALETADGSERWTAETGDVTGVAVGDDAAYVGAQSTAYAVGLGDGRERWTAAFEGHGLYDPAVGDAVYLGDEDDLRAYDPDGSERWQYAQPHSSFVLGDRPVVGGDRVVALSDAGESLWTSDDGGHVSLAAGGAVFGVRPGEAFALSADGGEERWSRPLGGDPSSPFALADGAVAFGESPLVVRDAADGSVRWRTTSGVAPPAVADGVALLPADGELRALSLAVPD
jgi:outer membrane protein assembly factor BamB